MKIYTETVHFDEETKEYFINIPKEIISELDLKPNDVLVWEIQKDKLILSKRIV